MFIACGREVAELIETRRLKKSTEVIQIRFMDDASVEAYAHPNVDVVTKGRAPDYVNATLPCISVEAAGETHQLTANTIRRARSYSPSARPQLGCVEFCAWI